jgi:outer membrane protein assembly factor BamB
MGLSRLAIAETSWPDYRGPKQDGSINGVDLPLQWSEGNQVVWKTVVHGRGWSSPVVADDQVWLTTATPDGRELYVLCVDATSGKMLLNRKLFQIAKPQFAHAFNSYASPSPLIDSSHVYVSFGSPGTACLDLKTHKTLWERTDLVCDHFRGAGSSPFVY